MRASQIKGISIFCVVALAIACFSYSDEQTALATGEGYDYFSGDMIFRRLDFAQAKTFSAKENLRDFFATCREEFYKQVPIRLLSPLTLEDLSAVLSLFDFPSVRYEYVETPNGHDVLVNLAYTPGARMAEAYLTRDTSNLTANEMMVYGDVVAYLNMVFPWNGTPIEQERSIHDYICQRCEYWTSDEEPVDSSADFRTAIGVFLDGRGNCMAYSDAFVMLGQMTGMRVFTVRGESGITEESMIAHAWNAIEIQGKWYFVDVTHNDMSHGEFANDYVYFNIGQEMISHTHRWPEGSLFVPVERYIDDTYAYGNAQFPDLIRAADTERLSTAIVQRSREGMQHTIYAMCDNFQDLTERYMRAVIGRIVADGYTVSVNYSPYHMGNTLYLSMSIAKTLKDESTQLEPWDSGAEINLTEKPTLPKARPKR